MSELQCLSLHFFVLLETNDSCCERQANLVTGGGVSQPESDIATSRPGPSGCDAGLVLPIAQNRTPAFQVIF